MQDAHFNTTASHRIAVLQEAVDHSLFRRRHPDPLGLHLEFLKQKQIRLVDRCRCSGKLLKLMDGADVVNVCVRTDDLFYVKTMLGQTAQDLLWIVPRINDDRFARFVVA